MRADFGRGPGIAAQHVVKRALGPQLAVGDDDDLVDGLSDLGEDVT